MSLKLEPERITRTVPVRTRIPLVAGGSSPVLMSLPLALFSAFLCSAIAIAIECMMGECGLVCFCPWPVLVVGCAERDFGDFRLCVGLGHFSLRSVKPDPLTLTSVPNTRYRHDQEQEEILQEQETHRRQRSRHKQRWLD